MKLKPLTVGPIVGRDHASSSAYLWAWRGRRHPRAAAPMLRRPPLPADRGAELWTGPRIFKMNPNFDMTGVAVLTGLDDESRYEYEVGYFFADVELSDAKFRETNGRWDERLGRCEPGSIPDRERRSTQGAHDRPRLLSVPLEDVSSESSSTIVGTRRFGRSSSRSRAAGRFTSS